MIDICFSFTPEQRVAAEQPLDWLLEMAEVAVVRNGAKIIQIDPWNRLEGSRDYRGSSETELHRTMSP